MVLRLVASKPSLRPTAIARDPRRSLEQETEQDAKRHTVRS